MKLFEYIVTIISILGVFYKLTSIERSLSDSIDEIKIKIAVIDAQQEEKQEHFAYLFNAIDEKINHRFNRLNSDFKEIKNRILKE
jgi:chaperonin cofactor prefoldin